MFRPLIARCDSSKFYLIPALDSGTYSQAEKLQSQYTRMF